MDDNIKLLKMTIGALLIFAGSYILYIILKELWLIYSEFESSAFIAMLMKLLSGKEFMTLGDYGTIKIGEGMAFIGCLVALFVIASLAVNIALSLLKNGVNLLSPSIKKDINDIKQKLKTVIDDKFTTQM